MGASQGRGTFFVAYLSGGFGGGGSGLSCSLISLPRENVEIAACAAGFDRIVNPARVLERARRPERLSVPEIHQGNSRCRHQVVVLLDDATVLPMVTYIFIEPVDQV